MMERQLNRPLKEPVEEGVESLIEHQLEERTQLQLVLCDLSKDLSAQAIVALKVSAVNLQIALASAAKGTHDSLATTLSNLQDSLKGQSPVCRAAPTPALDSLAPASQIPLVLEKTQCIFCTGNEALSYGQRTRELRRPSHMEDYVEPIHVHDVPVEQQIICQHPICKAGGLIPDGVVLSKHHVARVHKVRLRPKVFPSQSFSSCNFTSSGIYYSELSRILSVQRMQSVNLICTRNIDIPL
ncbi:hypothetical protein IFR04_011914 [Cadophora malorum]|uniref:Uncharacterized protein n=1 Tax=Cadophora malorum TaxID=108018 RepID=A0A8H7T8A4_9HELO|nr:hypothetical protein IFR04_011914 [Cadophora malorum]